MQGVETGRLDWVKTQVCIIFLSEQGAGKGTLTRHFRRILGKQYACQITKKKDLFGNFNDFTACKLWVEMDELLWAGNTEQAGEFKNMTLPHERITNSRFLRSQREICDAAFAGHVARAISRPLPSADALLPL